MRRRCRRGPSPLLTGIVVVGAARAAGARAGRDAATQQQQQQQYDAYRFGAPPPPGYYHAPAPVVYREAPPPFVYRPAPASPAPPAPAAPAAPSDPTPLPAPQQTPLPLQALPASIPPITFYTHPLAFSPAKVAIMLAEKKLRFNTVTVDILTGGNLEPKFMRVNPAAQVPLVNIGGKALLGSKHICEVLDVIGGSQLLGGDKVDRAFVERFAKDIDDFNGNLWAFGHSPAAVIAKLKSIDKYRKAFAAARAKEFPDLQGAYDAKMKTMGVVIDDACDRAKVAAVDLVLAQLLDKAEERLSKTGEQLDSRTPLFLAGTEYSIVDALFAPILFRIEALGFYDSLIGPRLNLAEYMQRVRSRPSWQVAFGQAGASWGKGKVLNKAMVKIKFRSLLKWY